MASGHSSTFHSFACAMWVSSANQSSPAVDVWYILGLCWRRWENYVEIALNCSSTNLDAFYNNYRSVAHKSTRDVWRAGQVGRGQSVKWGVVSERANHPSSIIIGADLDANLRLFKFCQKLMGNQSMRFKELVNRLGWSSNRGEEDF